MRDIYFRGKSIYNGEWVYGGVVHQTDYYGGSCNRWFIIQGDTTHDYDIGYENEVIPESVCQFTGLYAKNGLIFEGDILVQEFLGFHTTKKYKVKLPQYISKFRFDRTDDGVIREYYHLRKVVKWNDKWAMWDGLFRWEDKSFSTEDLIVIGNIYDNPELLEFEEGGDT